MKRLRKEELIRCYQEDRTGCCKCEGKGCPLSQSMKKMPYGIDENMAALTEKVLEPVLEAYGKPVVVEEGFVCPFRCTKEQDGLLRMHTKGEAVRLRAAGLQGNDLRLENLEIARAVVRHGKWDLLVLMDTTGTGVEPKGVVVGYSRGKNHGVVLKKAEGRSVLEGLSELDWEELKSSE